MDDAASLLGAVASGDVAEVAKDIGGRLNPMLKYPLELASGQSLYHGRPLSTIAPDVGTAIHNLSGAEGKAQPFFSLQVEHALRNSPFARYLSTARKATNPNADRAATAAALASGLNYGQ
ncbi:MAG: hypothetical protein R3C09_22755 [Pirellulaceae bacterium]